LVAERTAETQGIFGGAAAPVVVAAAAASIQ
jgi:hypothetical protein